MFFRLAQLLAVMAASAAGVGCNAPTCGPGTKQVQDDNGNITCVAAEVSMSGIDCDAAQGGVIVAGHCVSRTMCGANTQPAQNPDGTISCIGTGVVAHVPPACASPPSGSICVRGTIHHLLDSSFLSGEHVQVRAHDPTAFLLGDHAPLKSSTGSDAVVADVTDTFLLADVKVASNQLAISVAGPGGDTSTYQLTACGALVAAGQSYTIDCYVTPKTLLTSWKATSGNNTDYDAGGAYVAFFFGDLLPPNNEQAAVETAPLSGVKLLGDSGSPPANVRYFGGGARSSAVIDPTLTATGASGGAIVPNNIALMNAYTGQGGMYMGAPVTYWEAGSGASAAGVVFVQRFHRCNNASCT